MKEQAYLGDGVYIVPDPNMPDHLVMTTGAHWGSKEVVTNTIHLEPETTRELYAYLRRFYGDI